jgi:hypothetical protein
MNTYDPTKWVTTMQRALKDYVEAEIDAAIGGGGLNVFNVVFDYPVSAAAPLEADLTKTIIHLEIDDVLNTRIGFGRDVFAGAYTPGNVANAATLVESEARCHRVNFDVGVWASDLSGGSTSRLIALEILDSAFGGEMARHKCMAATGGVEITSFNGGKFVVDTLNDVRVFRIVDSALDVRVYSRKDGEEMIVADTISQDPHFTILGTPIS